METDGTGSPELAGMYRYDDFGKLTIARTAAGTGRYTYDATGNITQITNTKDGTTETLTLEYDTASGWKDRLVKVNGASLQYYDNSPGLPSVYQNGRTYNLTWGGICSELSRAEVGGATVDFSYFFGGLRKTKTSGGVTKNYYYDGDRLIAEKWSTGAYLLYHYDETGSPYAITYSATGGEILRAACGRRGIGRIGETAKFRNGISRGMILPCFRKCVLAKCTSIQMMLRRIKRVRTNMFKYRMIKFCKTLAKPNNI